MGGEVSAWVSSGVLATAAAADVPAAEASSVAWMRLTVRGHGFL